MKTTKETLRSSTKDIRLSIMKHKQLLVLFICHSIPPLVAMGLFPVLPMYAAQLGATPTIIGLYFAIQYGASLLSTFTTRWLASHWSRKRLLVGVGVMGVPLLILLGQATTIWQAMLLTALLWFVGSTIINMIHVFTGTITNNQNHGQVFSLLFLSFPIGAVLGGAVVGQLVAYRGYSFMFTMLGVGWVALPVIGWLGLHEPRTIEPTTIIRTSASPRIGSTFALLLVAVLLSSMAVNISRLSTSLVMQTLSFSPRAIASTGIVAGLATIPLVLVLGRVSDRLGHRRMLGLSYGGTLLGASVLFLASHLWHFQLAATLLFVAWCTNGSASSALTTALVPADALGAGLPRVKAMESLAAIVGFASAGWLMATVTERGVLVIVVILMLGALQIMALLTRRTPSTPLAVPTLATPELSVARASIEVTQR